MDLDLQETEAPALPSSLVDASGLPRILPAGLSSRLSRIFELRKVIEAGEYQVSSGDLADALLRSGRSAN